MAQTGARDFQREKSCPFLRSKYQCHSKDYAHVFHSLPALNSSLLSIQEAEHVLVYGPSYARQLMIAMVCNSLTPPARVIRRPCIPAESKLMDKYVDGLHDQKQLGSGWLSHLGQSVVVTNHSLIPWSDLLTVEFPNGGAVTGVFNCRILQDVSRMDVVLGAAQQMHLDQNRPFTHVIFMAPHPPCWFTRFDLLRVVPCVQTLRPSHKGRMNCTQAKAVLAALAPAAQQVVSATSWTEVNASQFGRECADVGSTAEHLAFSPFPLLKYACSVPLCKKSMAGHQCQPGTPANLAGDLLCLLRGQVGCA
eukprot:CAMPEP_0119410800 /NCGR_PEP_ID=MMETSP1335-20130426/3714_1 /TAXON_ID=259385 /ORGANISM="Chrysoculter rhomboideus, Strain RCC1486" /LENGTH=306 /DNA_ID=CAMNT_0007435379 /DNA_START=237 /DNA_END=1157 /DNA_ORIENTATION=+